MEQMYKLLIAYDISEVKLNESQEHTSIITFLKKQKKWIHLQKSVWIVISNITSEDMYNKLLTFVDKNTKNIISVIDISSGKINTNSYKSTNL